jgi:pyruvate/2-oxoglutarate/acetoin dehydrogenase E1 component
MQMPATLVLNTAPAASSVRKSPRASWSALFDYLDARLARVSQKDVLMPYKANLEQIALSSTAEMVDAAKVVSKP